MKNDASMDPYPDIGNSLPAPEYVILAVLALQLVCLPFTSPSPSIPGAIGIGCLLGLPSMLAVWSSIRTGFWRYGVAVCASCLNGVLLTNFANHEFDIMLFLLPMLITVPGFSVLAAVKIFFGSFSRIGSRNPNFQEGLHFKLSQLFVVTTVAAVLIAIFKPLLPLSTSAAPGHLVIVVALTFTIAINTLLCVWALLGKRSALRSAIAIPFGIGLLYACSYICDGNDDPVTWYTITGLPLLASFGLMLAFRISGWRFYSNRELES